MNIEAVRAFARKYPGEIILIFLACTASAAGIFLSRQESSPPSVLAASAQTPQIKKEGEDNRIAVEVSGAVVKPDVYLVKEGTHMKHVLELAGGLSSEADRFFVARNFNMAKYVVDQEKIYVPYSWDIAGGTFTEEKRILSYLQPVVASVQPLTDRKEQETVVSLNEGVLEELDTLPGIGPVSAQKIIDNRPYSSPEELTEKKVINAATFEKIKDYISL